VALSDRVVAPAADVDKSEGAKAYQEQSQAYTVLIPFYAGERVHACGKLPAESDSASMLLLLGVTKQQLLLCLYSRR
jgi:7-cyano-7-deazaguanine synthase in queuosine biosynthesis